MLHGTTIKHAYRLYTGGADSAHNEDLIAVFQNAGLTDILILDGGTSVAQCDYIDAEAGDVVWFVNGFRDCLKDAIAPGRSQQDSVALALVALRTRLHQRIDPGSLPNYAWPIAAMTWLRICETSDGNTVQAWCLGDCKTFVQLAGDKVIDLDPYVNPQEQILQNEIIKLTEQGVVDAAARHERLLPMLRERRVFLNTTPAPTVLCLDPRGPFAARVHTASLEQAVARLAMTDGFYRMVDTYAMFSNEELAALCRTGGVAAMLAHLRAFEAANLGSASLALKRADDASALLCTFAPRA